MNVDYFIKKFEAIPEEEWCVGAFTHPFNPKAHCVMGHCGVCRLDNPELACSGEAAALRDIFGVVGLNPSSVNDTGKSFSLNNGFFKEFPQETPKQRILSALRKIKNQSL